MSFILLVRDTTIVARLGCYARPIQILYTSQEYLNLCVSLEQDTVLMDISILCAMQPASSAESYYSYQQCPSSSALRRLVLSKSSRWWSTQNAVHTCRSFFPKASYPKDNAVLTSIHRRTQPRRLLAAVVKLPLAFATLSAKPKAPQQARVPARQEVAVAAVLAVDAVAQLDVVCVSADALREAPLHAGGVGGAF